MKASIAGHAHLLRYEGRKGKEYRVRVRVRKDNVDLTPTQRKASDSLTLSYLSGVG